MTDSPKGFSEPLKSPACSPSRREKRRVFSMSIAQPEIYSGHQSFFLPVASSRAFLNPPEMFSLNIYKDRDLCVHASHYSLRRLRSPAQVHLFMHSLDIVSYVMSAVSTLRNDFLTRQSSTPSSHPDFITETL
jgi:hypothetical protein